MGRPARDDLRTLAMPHDHYLLDSLHTLHAFLGMLIRDMKLVLTFGW